MPKRQPAAAQPQRSQEPRGGSLGPFEALQDAAGILDALRATRRPKYGNRVTEIDGLTFASAKEAARYLELKAALAAGAIRDLEVHPRFPLVVHGQDCGAYVGDFAFVDAAGVRHLEDVKSPATRKLAMYRFRRRLVWALYGLQIKEV